MLNKKIVSVLAVTLMLTMGIGVVFIGNDESEGTSTETPMGNLTLSIADMIAVYDDVTSYTLAVNSVVNIDWYNNVTDYIQITSSTYSDNAGLTADINNRYVKGMINKDTPGTIQVTCTRSSPSVTIVVSLNIIDMSSTQSEPWTAFSLPSSAFLGWGDQKTMYIKTGTVVDVPATTQTYESATISYSNSSVTSGFGLTVSAGALSGTVSGVGTITVSGTQTVGSVTQNRTVTLVAVEIQHADVRMIGGETWTYTPTTNMTSVLSISGTATSWVSLTSGTVSGTAPTNTSVGQTYDLTITASTSDPNQNATQTVSFTVDPPITLTVPKDPWIFQSGSGSADVASSNFEDGTRAIYSVSGTSGYSINAATGVLSSSDVTDGFVTVTVSSPYSYTSGATNSTSAALSLKVQGDDVIPEMVLNLYVDENSSDQTYDVTWGTYLNLSWDENISGGTTISGLSAGLSVSGNTIRDYLIYSSGPMAGTITISIGSPDSIQIVLNVIDMTTTSSSYLSELNVPLNFGTSGYGTIYVAVGSPVTITPVTINGTTYGPDSVTSGYGLSISPNGVLSGTITQAGTITVAADETDFSIIAVESAPVVQLIASVSGTLYLVTGKTVPNTPAEAVTLNHNDVGVGTYTWAVVGTNTSGVTVASDGTLGGTPGNVGTYAVTVRCTSVVDGETQTADATLNIVIVQVLAFTSSPSSGTIR